MSNIEEKVDKYMKLRYSVNEDIGFKSWPDGGNRDSLKKGAKTFADNHNGKMPGDESGWYTCVDAMKDEEGFDKETAEKGCSAFRDEYLQKTTGRGKDKDEE